MTPPESEAELDAALVRLRREIWRRRPVLPVSFVSETAGAVKVQPELAGLRGEIDLSDRVKDVGTRLPALPHYGRFRRRLGRYAGRVLLYLLKVVTADQRTFNVSVVSALRHIEDALATNRAEIDSLRAGLDELPGRGGAAGRERERVALSTLFDVSDLSERVRGLSEELSHRFASYAELFTGRRAVLDVGCGTGAFVQACQRVGVGCRGVDSDPEMVRACAEAGVEAVHADALEYLDGLETASLDGLFSAQFVEHLIPRELVEFVRLAAEKVAPGGRIVIETLNPECLQVQYRWFWLDPTHQRLVHPFLLRDLLGAAGFCEAEIHNLSPVPAVRIPELRFEQTAPDGLDEFNRATAFMNEVLYASADYFIVATR